MATLSKLLCEYIVTANVNDRFKIQDSAAAWHTITLTAGRYRDHVALGFEMQTQLNAATSGGTGQTWGVGVDSSTGHVGIASSASWDIDWDTASWGTTLRDDLGFDGTETVGGNELEASDVHLGGLYPSEPVEADTRPSTTGTDRWNNDAYQQEAPTGHLATVGGGYLRYKRSLQLLLAQDDLEAFATWLERAGQGFSFAFYHDRTQVWPGPSSEYEEYVLRADSGGDGVAYDPEPVDPGNTIWHRQTLPLGKRVAPTV